eukprot:TRINITY_DN8296_c0_g1_i1.p1 TRINITY_DN8296_c0_g1~~TRINITY_DN8296_c0_g1_i1.p1  ORF type:complete len:703 (-),score=165.05 TRINITY_DN8296_c0_g1_i1:20-2128(-)
MSTSKSQNESAELSTRGLRRQDLVGKIPRYLSVLEYAKRRKTELKLLISAIETKTGTRRVFQTLPKHLRRRAMSHNPRRMPRRLRDAAEREFLNSATKPPGKKHRAHKRRPGYALNDYIRRQMTAKWLETHLWSAKRMRMEARWGFKLAIECNDKGDRSIYYASSYASTMYDASYQGIVEMSGDYASLHDLLKTITDPDRAVMTSNMFISGDRSGSCYIYHPGSHPKKLIAEIKFLWRPLGTVGNSMGTVGVPDSTTQTALWMWYHPLVETELMKVLQQQASTWPTVTVTNLNYGLNRFELRGPSATQILRSVIHPTEKEPPFKFWNYVSKIRSPASVPSGKVVAISSMIPVLNTYKKATTHHVTNFSQDESSQWEEISHAFTAHSPLWDRNFRENSEERKFLPIIAIQVPGNLSRGYGSGWDVISPAGSGKGLWLSLSYAGARAIGLKERNRIQFEEGRISFPEDFPGTEAYFQHESVMSDILTREYHKRPPAKRANFFKLKISHPFTSPWKEILGIPNSEEIVILAGNHLQDFQDWISLSPRKKTSSGQKWVPRVRNSDEIPPSLRPFFDHALVRVTIRMTSKGTSPRFSTICHPTMEDIQEMDSKKNNSEWNPPLEKIRSENSPKTGWGDQSVWDTSRRIMGYVCQGKFSYVRGEGFAFGLVRARDMRDIVQMKKQNRVLVRSPTSLQYRMAYIALQQF